jgi:hypothetical protein
MYGGKQIHYFRRDEINFEVGMEFNLAGIAIDGVPEHGITPFKVMSLSDEYKINSTLSIDVHVIKLNS